MEPSSKAGYRHIHGKWLTGSQAAEIKTADPQAVWTMQVSNKP